MRQTTQMWIMALLLLLASCSRGGTGAELPVPAPAEAGAGVVLRDGQPVQVGTFNIERSLVVGDDGAVREVRRLTATDLFAAYWRSQLDAIRQAARREWTLEARDEGGQVVITMTRDYASYEEFNLDTGGRIEVVEHPLFQKVVFRQSLAFDPGALARDLPPPRGINPEEWAKFLAGQVRWSQTVTLPGPITSHNMDVANGNTVTWARSVGKIPGQANLTAETRVFRKGPMAVTAVLALLLIGGPLAVRLTRRWWDAEAE